MKLSEFINATNSNFLKHRKLQRFSFFIGCCVMPPEEKKTIKKLWSFYDNLDKSDLNRAFSLNELYQLAPIVVGMKQCELFHEIVNEEDATAYKCLEPILYYDNESTLLKRRIDSRIRLIATMIDNKVFNIDNFTKVMALNLNQTSQLDLALTSWDRFTQKEFSSCISELNNTDDYLITSRPGFSPSSR